MNLVEFWDEDYFENVSFTISYSLEFQAWASFHSYLPNFMFNDNKTFYSSIDEGIHDHSTGNFQTYYGQKKDHIVEVISNQAPKETKVFTGLTYSSVVEDYLPNQKKYRTVQDVTFSKLVAYTQDQTTGLQNMVVRSNPFNNLIQIDGTNISVYEKDSTWHVNELRDMNISHGGFPIFSSAWADIKDDYFIDKVPSLIVDSTKSLFERSRLRDKFLGVRLYFKPEYNYRISTDYIDVKQKLSIR